MSTKKLLVAYDESKPGAGKGDFLAVVFEGATPRFWGLRSRRIIASGRVVFLGKEITEKEIFAKLIESGRKIESVDQALGTLARYVELLQPFRIGNVLTVTQAAGLHGFELVRIAEAPRFEVKSMP